MSGSDEQDQRAEETKREWNTDPLFASQGGPDNASDGVMAAANAVVALWRKFRIRISR